MMALPALLDGDGPILFESLAIIEYLDEVHPQPPLLRAIRKHARACAGSPRSWHAIHPLIVPRSARNLEYELKIDEPTRMAWCRHWHTEALTALETNLKGKETGRFCHGDQVTIADICRRARRGREVLQRRHRAVPQFRRIAETCQRSTPSRAPIRLKQPGAPAAT